MLCTVLQLCSLIEITEMTSPSEGRASLYHKQAKLGIMGRPLYHPIVKIRWHLMWW